MEALQQASNVKLELIRQLKIKEYKGRIDSNNPTGPNEAVRVATLLLNIYLIETKGQQSGRLLATHLSLQPKLAGRENDTM